MNSNSFVSSMRKRAFFWCLLRSQEVLLLSYQLGSIPVLEGVIIQEVKVLWLARSNVCPWGTEANINKDSYSQRYIIKRYDVMVALSTTCVKISNTQKNNYH
jgi:hypothetical protein